jgi:hypothetical protein
MIVFVGTTMKKTNNARNKTRTTKNKSGDAFFSGIGFILMADSSGDNCDLYGECTFVVGCRSGEDFLVVKEFPQFGHTSFSIAVKLLQLGHILKSNILALVSY